ncbi:DUF763 domain-containing protein [Pseudobacter ginsenosidimutans]|uniref:DUF763 domain-containing protein n=1 Tax=Pseudobacter ginsenosidimutans TaxID=661488 RepID=A0A4Q7MYK6_9BACT|nr:DUF763 domain-containing protein [Pseudobacter ginsenosidimutans]QEC42961.1 DUF763 domain-containing protein [Pseudobacter ginsenosidimutans]RZS74311.1 hypothetical protein EV199_0155 [Pseudobacter ginsenosidimutans]
MKRSGSADLPLHYGHVPKWLADRMAKLGLAITESILTEYSKEEMLRRLSDPFWFQSFGAVLGMDWHSSGITTSVLGALKRAINPHSKQLGIYICGGKGNHSRATPAELLRIAAQTGIDGQSLVRCSKLSAKVDNTAIQDGFQLYLHHFIVSDNGHWTVVQQGMDTNSSMARRYHWHSGSLRSFVEEPHTGVCGINQGPILNLTASEADITRNSIMGLVAEDPGRMLNEVQKLLLPRHHEVRAEDVNLKRLGSVLWLSQEQQPADFEELLLLQGVGPRTLQSLTLVSEVIHGTPSRFKDPARFSFAHGGKDGHPFPVPVNVYDETINVLKTAVEKAKLGHTDKTAAIKSLHEIAAKAESNFVPNANFDELIEKERNDSWKYGGRTVYGKSNPPPSKGNSDQLSLF